METRFDQILDQFESDFKSGKSPQIESYLQQVPEESRQHFLKALIALDVFYRVKQGQTVSASEYARFGGAAAAHAEQAIGRNSGAETEMASGPDATGGLGLDGAVTQGQRIGPYKLVQQLGEGGMGTVWLAEQEQPVKRRVALKLIKAELASKEIIARFEAERQALAMMDHQHIAKVLDAGTTESGSPYFVMELVKGVPLTQYCDSNKLSVDERLRLFIPVCRAVQHAHQKGIIHRDLKPSNVLVTLADGEAVPKVIDFGLAKATEHTLKLTDKTMFTEFGNIVGTLQYMSPEQAETNSLDIDTRSDIYSLGVMLYELLTGSTPLDKETLGRNALLQVLEIIREKDPPRPSHRLSSSSGEASSQISDQRRISSTKLQQVLKGDLDWVVMKALDKDRTRRYQTANDLAQDVFNYLTGDAVDARPPSAVYRFRKFVRKNKVSVGIVAGLFALVTGSAITIAGALANANVARAEAEASATRSEKILAIVGDSFDAPNPDSGATADMSAKDVLLKAKESLDSSDLDDLGKIHLLDQLCSSFLGLGQYDLAIQVAEEWRDLSTTKLGQHHQTTLTAMNQLAIGYQKAGRLEAATELAEQTLQIRKKTLGVDHPHTLVSMTTLANIHNDAGRSDEAITLNETVLKLRKAKLGQEHPGTVGAMSSLANKYRLADRIDDAIALNEQVLPLMEANLGPDHPDTLSSMFNLAVSYKAAERFDEAIELLEPAIAISGAKLGPDHPDTVSSMNSLANIYAFVGRIEEAIELNEQVLQSTKATLGPDHPHALTMMHNLAFFCRMAGQTKKAVELSEQVLPLLKAKLGPDHRTVFAATLNLTACYGAAGRPEDAIELGKRTLSLLKSKMGLDDSLTLSMMVYLAENYETMGQVSKALELRRQRFGLLNQKFDADHPQTRSAQRDLVWLLVKSPERVSPLRREATDYRQQVAKSPNQENLRVLAAAEHRLGNFAAAISAAESAVVESTDQANPINFAILAMSHFQLGEVEKANDFREQIGESMKLDEFKDDEDCLLFADEVDQLFASKPAAIESGSED